MSGQRDAYRPGGFWDPQDTPLSRVEADRQMRVGAFVLGFGFVLVASCAWLLSQLTETPDHHGQIVLIAAVLFVLANGVGIYGGIKYGHGHRQGGRFDARTVRAYWAMAEYGTLAVAVLTMAGVVLGAAIILMSSLPAYMWVLLIVVALHGLAVVWTWRLIRDRRLRLLVGEAPPE